MRSSLAVRSVWTVILMCGAVGSPIAHAQTTTPKTQPPAPKTPAPSKPQPAAPAPTRPQPPGTPSATTPPKGSPDSLANKIMVKGATRDWILQTSIQLQAYTESDSNGLPVVTPISFNTAAVVFPVVSACATSRTNSRLVTGELKFDEAVVDDTPQFQDGYQSGTRLARWEMTNKEGRFVDLEVKVPMTCWETKFDEELADKVPWPSGPWPQAAQSTFRPQAFIEAESEEVAGLVKKWTEGKDVRKTITPMKLAKLLGGKVMEHVQVTGEGMNFNKNSSFQGFALQGSIITARDRKGSEHDMACLLCAVWRAAGLPARTVIGYDLSAQHDSNKFLTEGRKSDRLRSWVEFCLVDPATQEEIWVPFDITKQREQGSRAPKLDRTWRHFGSFEDGEFVLPIAFQYHPPTNVQAQGSVCFWGWVTTPTSQLASQAVRFVANQQSKRAGDPIDGRQGGDPKK